MLSTSHPGGPVAGRALTPSELDRIGAAVQRALRITAVVAAAVEPRLDSPIHLREGAAQLLTEDLPAALEGITTLVVLAGRGAWEVCS